MHPFITSVQEPAKLEEPAYYFVFSGSHLLVYQDDEQVEIPRIMALGELPWHISSNESDPHQTFWVSRFCAGAVTPAGIHCDFL